MSAGYGRGHYGDEQLARPRTSSSSGGGRWFKIAAVVGLGATLWWWVLPAMGLRSKHVEYAPMPLPPEPSPSFSTTTPPSFSSTTPLSDLDRLARAHGFTSTTAYEDAVVTSARELRSSGARIELSPTLQHLMPRVES